jgi:hypothetical protein
LVILKHFNTKGVVRKLAVGKIIVTGITNQDLRPYICLPFCDGNKLTNPSSIEVLLEALNTKPNQIQNK